MSRVIFDPNKWLNERRGHLEETQITGRADQAIGFTTSGQVQMAA
jgi:hypothetical protein